MSAESDDGLDNIPVGFPQTKQDAIVQLNNTRSQDPFPDIAPALLNSADIFDYARETGMVFPFIQSHLKSASYSIRIGDQIIYWNEEGQLVNKNLCRNEQFCLPMNSIVFIKTEEVFLLPFYMAMRFNLKIDKVHKGLLLGTGPLVDPGFEGHLFIPLHNLTTNNYYLYRGQQFVWVEFTKISKNRVWSSDEFDPDIRKGEYVEFPERKKWMNPVEYLNDAHQGEIRSSLPQLLKETRDELRRAKLLSIVAVIGGLSIIVTMFLSGSIIINGLHGRIDGISGGAQLSVEGEERQIGQILEDIDVIEQQLNLQKVEEDARASRLEDAIDKLDEEVNRLLEEVDGLDEVPNDG